ncbi:MAG: AbrB/MazE/SpoVT family DNA-binding domain-containing protein [Candidatus Limnocylindrales bacterium]
MLSVKVSTKHQIVVPSEARKRLGVEAGDRLSVEIQGDSLVLRKRPAKASERLRGLCRGMYGPNPDEYVRQLRLETEERALEREDLVRRDIDRSAPQGRA